MLSVGSPTGKEVSAARRSEGQFFRYTVLLFIKFSVTSWIQKNLSSFKSFDLGRQKRGSTLIYYFILSVCLQLLLPESATAHFGFTVSSTNLLARKL